MLTSKPVLAAGVACCMVPAWSLAVAPPHAEVGGPGEHGSCGAESLWALSDALGVGTARHELVARLGGPGAESSMLRVREAAAESGIRLVGRRMDYTGLCDEPRPVIAHLRWGHFVVVTRATSAETEIIDGYDGRVTVAADTFRKQWSGHALVPSRRDRFAVAGGVLAGAGTIGLLLSLRRGRRSAKGRAAPIARTELGQADAVGG